MTGSGNAVITVTYPAARTIRKITSCQYSNTAPLRAIAMLNTRVQTVSSLTLEREEKNVEWRLDANNQDAIGPPVVSVSRDAQNDTDDRVNRDEAGPCQDLIVHTEAIVIPLAVIRPVQFQGLAAAVTKRYVISAPR